MAWKVAQIPKSVWESNDPSQITAYLIGASQPDDLSGLQSETDRINEAMELAAPPGFMAEAENWVHTVNLSFPGTILWFDADSRGNLYVVLGGWLELLPDQSSKVLAMKNLAAAWRVFLSDLVGPVTTQSGFSPGIVYLDKRGIAATDLNGTFSLYHMPNDTVAGRN